MGGLIAITDPEQLHPDRVSATRAARAAVAHTARASNESATLAAVDRAMRVQRGPQSALRIAPRTAVLGVSNLFPVTAADVARVR